MFYIDLQTSFMDIAKIKDFLDYQPIFEKNPRELLDNILAKLDYLTADDKQQVYRAYEFARKHHEDVKRLSGEYYIIHPVKVLEFLIDIKPDVPTMQTALLHDIIEDTPVTREEIEEEFGEEVAFLCVGLEKVGKVRYKGEDRQIETLKKTFLAMGKDLRVIFIKLADRIHNIQTLHFHPKPEKQKRIAQETLKVYVPIARRLWLYIYQGYLENGAFKILNPDAYHRIASYIDKEYGNADELKNTWTEKLHTMLTQDNIAILELKWRVKSPYRVWKKLKKYETNDIRKVMDILAFRVIVESVAECYTVLWTIHNYYTPIFSKMKDYIAIPKSNGYKSLHTTLLGVFPFPIEIQVRTKEMDEIAEYGVAAHFAYKESGGKPVSITAKQSEWIEHLQEVVEKYQHATNKDGFKDELDIEILQKSIYVYTPQGDIIELPMRSTVLDFAFRVHTDVGLKFKNAFVNGRIVPIDYTLHTGDIVSIETFKNKFTAATGWLKFLHTPSARSKLTRHLRKVERDTIVARVSEQINDYLQRFDLPLLHAKDDKITKQRKGKEFDRLIYKIYDKQFSIMKLLQDTYQEVAKHHSEFLKEQEVKKQQKTNEVLLQQLKKTTPSVVIDGDKQLPYKLCQTCKPNPSHKIIAKSDRHGIKIHAVHCGALQTASYNKLLAAQREGKDPVNYTLNLTLKVTDKPWVLLQILKIFDFLVVNVHDIEITHQAWWVDLSIDVDIINPYKMFYVIEELKNKEDLLTITAKKIR